MSIIIIIRKEQGLMESLEDTVLFAVTTYTRKYGGKL